MSQLPLGELISTVMVTRIPKALPWPQHYIVFALGSPAVKGSPGANSHAAADWNLKAGLCEHRRREAEMLGLHCRLKGGGDISR